MYFEFNEKNMRDKRFGFEMKKNRSKETTKRKKPKTTDIETEKQRVL